MKKSIILMALLTLIIFHISSVPAETVKINVIVSVGSLKPIVEGVLGNTANIDFIVPETSDPHTYSLSHEDYEKIRRADLIVLADSENFSIESMIKKTFKDKNFTDLKDYIRHGAKLHQLEGYGRNFHAYWLYPTNALAIASTIKEYLSKNYPHYSERYEGHYREFRDRVLSAWKYINKTARTESCIVTEPGAAYVAETMNFKVRGTLAIEPEMIAEGKEIERLIKLVKSGEVKFIVCPEELKNTKVDKMARDIAKSYNARLVYVKMFSTMPYDALLYYNLACFENYHTISATTEEPLIIISIIVLGLVAIIEFIIIVMVTRKK